MDSLALLLQLVEVSEISLPLPEHQKFFSLILNFVWIFLIDGEIHFFILSQTKSWQHSRVPHESVINAVPRIGTLVAGVSYICLTPIAYHRRLFRNSSLVG